jgi:hypothetical protein
MDETRILTGLPPRVAMWIAACFIGLVASGAVPIIRAFSFSYAGLPVEGPQFEQGTDPPGSGARQSQAPLAKAMVAPRNGVWCAECGVIASMRRSVRSDGTVSPGAVVAGLAGTASGGTSGQAVPSDGETMAGYEFTVRFRDGSAIVFNETTPRTWQPGSRVIVIGRTHASTVLR